ncbi:MAG TPA: tRNA pseudouridine(38-40) synthase TruA [Candidatus Krumholzibacteria bacterium]|nr:tRNA pseudouridine(38-40) synthase TruA [Candidatus Krumholzibacteria bacterium]
MTLRVKIDLAYVGTGFHGWQVQPDLRTVQGELARAAGRLLGRDVMPVGAGRTDTGVHARGQVAHLDVADAREAERLARALAGVVPDDMAVAGVALVSPDFNARLSAESRRYSYHLLRGRDIFRPHAWQLGGGLDQAAMDRAAAHLQGEHDFTSFCKASSLKDDGNACSVDLCRFEWSGDWAILHVRANRFLHHMVRNLVGTLVEVGLGRRDPDEVPDILAARARSRAGGMAPPQGLFLEEVRYPGRLLDPAWREPAGAVGVGGDPHGPAGADAAVPEGENP